jgi:hypothetical protein
MDYYIGMNFETAKLIAEKRGHKLVIFNQDSLLPIRWSSTQWEEPNRVYVNLYNNNIISIVRMT